MNDTTEDKRRQGAVPAEPEAEYSDDALAEIAVDMAKEADRLFRMARSAREELGHRMAARNATVLDTPHWKGKIKPGLFSHTVDDPNRFRGRLRQLGVSDDDLDAAFVQPPTPGLQTNHARINDFHKRGGQVAEVIEEERSSVRGTGHLELERKPQKED